MPLIRSASFNLFIEVLLRVALLSAFCYMESMTPFERVIPQWELETNCKYPRHESYVPGSMLWSIVLSVPCILSFLAWAVCNDCNDALEILLAWSLSLGLTGFLTNLLKLTVGRPRPDFFYRCFPDGVQTADFTCTGDAREVMDGRKSFPSGHSSLSFCSLGVCALWLAGRLEALSRRRGDAARLLACVAPLCVALCVAVSRTCDYHHHWQDVLVGSILGLSVAYICYRQYYNSISSELAGVPHVISSLTTRVSGRPDISPAKQAEGKDGAESTPLLVNGGVKRRVSGFRVI
ncbi:hypothetical protein JYU34_018031 [Plutella xylostella]|uniref:Phosphatidic acid phosphatase type 2/haloperoxidase domain-containing protein n=1 Tax=Plutella xylostella TaxID=51655 RepID=A0ABQ7PZJ5_PLUXY|nr:hypothetical protein JYU34_018031 [Plutella xylostella]